MTSHIAAFLSVVLITEMLEICIQTSYDQNIQRILKSYLPVVYGTPLKFHFDGGSNQDDCDMYWKIWILQKFILHSLNDAQSLNLDTFAFGNNL